jgi:ABC-type multidrug transport system ATPase subunit
MTISLSDAGKRFNREWIFRHFNFTFESGQTYAITGPNGSGKSTLLQVLGGVLRVSEGACNWKLDGKTIAEEKVYNHISISAPYLELVEEMTLLEFLDFHHGFKPFLPGLQPAGIAETVGLKNALNKQVRYFSSGMKQRLKLAQCICSNIAVILLDEPCTNLDAEGITLYHRLVSDYGNNRLIVVSSNDEVEYSFCRQRINVMDFKGATKAV